MRIRLQGADFTMGNDSIGLRLGICRKLKAPLGSLGSLVKLSALLSLPPNAPKDDMEFGVWGPPIRPKFVFSMAEFPSPPKSFQTPTTFFPALCAFDHRQTLALLQPQYWLLVASTVLSSNGLKSVQDAQVQQETPWGRRSRGPLVLTLLAALIHPLQILRHIQRHLQDEHRHRTARTEESRSGASDCRQSRPETVRHCTGSGTGKR